MSGHRIADNLHPLLLDPVQSLDMARNVSIDERPNLLRHAFGIEALARPFAAAASPSKARRFRLHAGSVALAALTVLFASGCPATEGWSKADPGTCAPKGPAMLCVMVEQDRAVTVNVGGETLVPGECAAAPEKSPTGDLKLEVTESDGTTWKTRVRVQAGAVAYVRLTDDDRQMYKQLGMETCGG